ncbi:hypothetical protein BDQ12DRAFT_727142 [Crucibulum laeve]|uniref:Restriction of telomere capping protein 4 C-terminal domain-containing protein n=1 Tax=Crucibulum laeve TaxID=68775 RepID=A0A5C3LP83_9AGAR|nr:hypothetical protein BDQ12DRAFT_727142 [Crucibulum laeve]
MATKWMNAATDNVHCRYYGPGGQSIIRAALMGFDKTKFRRYIDKSIHDIMVMEYPRDFKPEEYVSLKFSDFINFILVPHVATLLIADNMDITQDKAQDECFASKAYTSITSILPCTAHVISLGPSDQVIERIKI